MDEPAERNEPTSVDAESFKETGSPYEVGATLAVMPDLPAPIRLVELAVYGVAEEMREDVVVERAQVERTQTTGVAIQWMVLMEVDDGAMVRTAEDVRQNLRSGLNEVAALARGDEFSDPEGLGAADRVANHKRVGDGR